MSTFMVEAKTIDRIVTWLRREVSTSHFAIDRLARKYGIDLGSFNWDEKLAKAMFQLKCDGVNSRYGEGQAERFRPLNFKYKPEVYFYLVQVLKSLHCWMYQCS